MEERILDVSIDGLKELGRGATSHVYQLDEDKIIKVFYPWMKKEDILREKTSSRTAFIKGVPSAITYHLARVGDSYGVIYELIDADTLAGTISKTPDQLDAYAEKAAGMLLGLHHTYYEKGELADIRDNWWGLCEKGLARFLSAEEKEKIRTMICDAPERNTFIHGDFHPLNIMVRKEELLLIDVGDASLGYPIFDLASVYMACMLLPRQSKAEHVKDLSLSADQWERFWMTFLATYQKDADAEPELTESRIRSYALLRMCMTRSMIPGMSDEEKLSSMRQALDEIMNA